MTHDPRLRQSVVQVASETGQDPLAVISRFSDTYRRYMNSDTHMAAMWPRFDAAINEEIYAYLTGEAYTEFTDA